MLFKILFISKLMFGASIMYSGNENFNQLIDKYKVGLASGQYDQQIVVYTNNNTFEGTLLNNGSSFIILETDTGRTTVDGKNSKKIFFKKILNISSIIGFEFKETKK